MLRRDFVRRLPVVTTGLVAGLSTLPLTACAGIPFVVPGVRPGGLVVSAAALAEGGEVFLQSPGMDRPVYVRRDAAGEIVALLASCTHCGCQPEPISDRLVCPCHGSQFSLTGSVLAGPAERPLTRYDVTEQGEEVIVWLERRGVR